MGFIKSILTFIIVIILIWVALGIYLKFFSNSFPEILTRELFFKAPKYIWELIKDWVTSI